MLALALSACLSASDADLAFLLRLPNNRSQIHTVSLASGVVRPVGPEGALDAPLWAPDGSQLAFTIATDAGTSIHIVDTATGQGHTLTHARPNAHDPTWSPDGNYLAYTVGHGLDAQIAVYDLTAGDESLWGGDRTSLMSPVWISDSLAATLLDPERQNLPTLQSLLPMDRVTSWLLLAVQWVGTADLTTSDLVVVSPQAVTPVAARLMPSNTGAYTEFAPAASSDSVAFESNDGGDREIFLITPRQTYDLSNDPSADWLPIWSNDGGSLAFHSFRGGNCGIYIAPARRAGQLRTVASFPDGDAWAPAWSPDDRTVAYVSNREGTSSIYVVNIDGSDRHRITPPDLNADHPQWRPRS